MLKSPKLDDYNDRFDAVFLNLTDYVPFATKVRLEARPTRNAPHSDIILSDAK